ncbi:hypothetical protein GCM10009771_12050 [Nesterenkonia flava]
MLWIEAIILGLVQGLTEFLPISSSAHLRIVGEFLPGAQDPGAAFTAITQLVTEAAVLVFFWRDIVRILKAWFAAMFGRGSHNDPDARMGWLIIVGTIPIVVLGLLLEGYIMSTFRSLWLVATMLIAFGILLGFADHIGTFGYRYLADQARRAGWPMSRKTAWKLCSQAGILSSAQPRRRGKGKKAGPPVFDDHVKRVFRAEAPNRV